MNDTTDTEDSGAGDDWAAAMAEQTSVEGEASSEAASAEADWGDALAEQASAEEDTVDKVEQAPMENLQAEGNGETLEDVSLDVILDIPVNISLQIGSAKISIRNLLKLNQGSVVELERLAGEPLDVKVNGTLIAHGEVVVVNEKYGIRLTDVISAQERIKKLK
ncbi:MAG: flagellar motor switch protein FliN [Gammaproteobacteria bacterium]|nr:flagellar motor switch protein FliN [Gammaproteobacteria bacterium]MCF6363731.1 flagellar motor switch protein FliN [Gammaproteobacteria bacterium]